jgi:hypothetical protein
MWSTCKDICAFCAGIKDSGCIREMQWVSSLFPESKYVTLGGGSDHRYHSMHQELLCCVKPGILKSIFPSGFPSKQFQSLLLQKTTLSIFILLFIYLYYYFIFYKFHFYACTISFSYLFSCPKCQEIYSKYSQSTLLRLWLNAA